MSFFSDDGSASSSLPSLAAGAPEPADETPRRFICTPDDDTFVGSTGNDLYYVAVGSLSPGDTLFGADGNDQLVVTTSGRLCAGAFANVAGIERIRLSSGGNQITLGDILVGGPGGLVTVYGGAGDDTIDASSATGGTVVVTLGLGDDTILGGGGNDTVYVAREALTAGDIITGGGGIDQLVLTSAGTVTVDALANVSSIERLRLADGGNQVTLTDGLVGSGSAALFRVYGGHGDDTVDASGVTVTVPVVVTMGSGDDTFLGGAGNDVCYVAADDLTAADRLDGGGGIDMLVLTSGGTVTAEALAQVSSFERLRLADDGNDITLSENFCDDLDTAYLSVYGRGGDDRLDAGAVDCPVLFTLGGGEDTFIGGSANDAVYVSAADLTAADILAGGGGSDQIVLTTTGTLADDALAGVSGIERLRLADGDNRIVVTDAVASATDSGAFTVYGGSGADLLETAATSGLLRFDGGGGMDTLSLGDAFDGRSIDLGDASLRLNRVEILSLTQAYGVTVECSDSEVAAMAPDGAALFILGGSDDEVLFSGDWSLVSAYEAVPSVSPDSTFTHLHSDTYGVDLYIGSEVTIPPIGLGFDSPEIVPLTSPLSVPLDALL